MSAPIKTVANGSGFLLSEIAFLGPDEFRTAILEESRSGSRLVSLIPTSQGLVAALADDASSTIGFVGCALERDKTYPSLTADWPQAQAFERDLFESHGITPEGHPWLKPLVFPDLPAGKPIPSGYEYFRAEGEETHEVAVGPVHAGIIEPGHFRFQCHGEEVLHLEIQLGYQHRGAEKIMREASPALRLATAESIAGDSVIAHATAFAMTEESFSGTQAPPRAQAIRSVALELERIANHVGDLGALAGDVGYLPSASFFGRIRGDYLNLTQGLCGNRFGKGLIVPGGVRFDATDKWIESALATLVVLKRDTEDTANLLFESASVQGRFEGVGVLHLDKAEALGIVGPAARASGCKRDVRREHPWGFYRFAQVPPQVLATGDVYARAMIRWLEIQQSIKFIEEHIQSLPSGAVKADIGKRKPESAAFAMVEGWRGETAHAAVTAPDGSVAAYKVTDPSMHNWFGLAMAMRGGAISDFPLCNKSFNLSYAGHDR